MEIEITLTDRETDFLQRMIKSDSKFETSVKTIEDAVHDCIKMAMFDEGETNAQQEGM